MDAARRAAVAEAEDVAANAKRVAARAALYERTSHTHVEGEKARREKTAALATEAAKEAILGGFEVSREGTCGGGCEDRIGRRRCSLYPLAFVPSQTFPRPAFSAEFQPRIELN